jgi:hypothetical protein
MAQTGYTPIQLYYSSTTTNVPLAANLASGELAINITDGKLFYKDSGGTVRTLAKINSAPVTATADYTVTATDVWVINNKTGSSLTVTLPTPSTNTGRVLTIQNYQVQTVISASSNVVSQGGGAASTAILAASAGDSATLVSDGTNWIMMQYASYNNLLIE